MKKTLIATTLFAASAIFATAQASVVTSIKPLAFIANEIAAGVTDTKVLVTGNQSPHTFTLTPSNLKDIKEADLLVFVDDDLEISLGKALDNPRVAPRHVLELSDIDAIERKLMKGLHYHPDDDDDDDHDHDHKHHHDHDHDHDHDDHDHDDYETDYHIWTSPDMGIKIAEAISRELQKVYPAQANKIRANYKNFKESVERNAKQLKSSLKATRFSNYYVYHPAYAYFEKYFDLDKYNRGAIYVNVSIDPSIKTINELNQRAKHDNVRVIFTEPQFNQSIAQKLANSINGKLGVLDPLGANIAVAPGAYNKFINNLASQFLVAKR